MHSERINSLLQKFTDSTLSDLESQELLVLLQDDSNESLREIIASIIEKEGRSGYVNPDVWAKMADSIVNIDKLHDQPQLKQSGKVRRLYPVRQAAAAAIVILVSVASWLIIKEKGPLQNNDPQVITKSIDLPPGRDRALLTLADGKTIDLGNLKNGKLVLPAHARIAQVAEGIVAIESHTSGVSSKALQMSSISTPRGGKYQVILSDGTKVWLNAESSIRFPVAFAAGARHVETTGEVYFEVAKLKGKNGKNKPFIVKSGNHQVEVLGTHFNINSYADEGTISTTLLEGRVKVSGEGSQPQILKPGQQSVLAPNKRMIIRDVDTGGVISWKNNLFRFKDENLRSVLRQVSRWYDVQIQYDGTIQDEHFAGYISRDVPISTVLKMLEETGDLQFTVHTGTVVVSSKSSKNK